MAMSFRRAWAIIRKELRHIRRDPRLFFLVTAGPVILLVTLSYVFALDIGQLNLAVYDLDKSDLSRRLLATLTADGDVRITVYPMHYGEVHALFSHEVADVVLVIPPGFAEQLLGGRHTTVQCLIDGADAVTARQALYALESRIAAFAAAQMPRLALGRVDRGQRIETLTRAQYNAALDSLVSMVPGLLAVILCMPVLALALALTREKEAGSFESLLVTPVRGAEYLLGKLAAYLFSGLLSATLTWLVAVSWFRVPFRGNFVLFLLLMADFLFAGMGIALLLANFTGNQQTITFLILAVLFVPSFFITGLIIPVSEEPFARWVARALPTTHAIAIARGVFLKGLGLTALWKPVATLAGVGMAGTALALALFRKRLM